MKLNIISVNTILYCRRWKETVDFYEHKLNFKKRCLSDWLIEFKVTDNISISLANENKTTIDAVNGQGITLSWQVDNIEDSWRKLKQNGINPEAIKSHHIGGRLFRFHDPEGHRLELWAS